MPGPGVRKSIWEAQGTEGCEQVWSSSGEEREGGEMGRVRAVEIS